MTCTKVSLKDAKMCATPNTTSPSRVAGPSDTFSSAFAAFLGAILQTGRPTQASCHSTKWRAILAAVPKTFGETLDKGR